MRQSVNAVINTRQDIINFLRSERDVKALFNIKTSMPPDRVQLYKNCYLNIGNTPVHIIQLKNGNRLYVKLEYKNAMGSNHYSRYWIPYLFIAETLGLIHPSNDTILEVSSGSSGIALSSACEKLGYRLAIVVPQSISHARLAGMQRPNTEIISVNGYINECIDRMKELRDTSDVYFMANHAEEKANIITYLFSRIAHEFCRQVGTPDMAILALGNGTSAEAVTTTFQSLQGKKNCWFIAYHPDFSRSETKPILGLLPPKVKFRHVESMREKINSIEFTNNYDITNYKNAHPDDIEVQRFGQTSLYAIEIAQKLATKFQSKMFFSIAYDTIDMYD